ncbi:MAG: hypothetical protein PQJ60_09550, partial [Spirochaetales bacterium]|nr:hypothetical protein [Spirochaetales bacterium]
MIRLLFLLRQRGIINRIFLRFMKKNVLLDWAVTHGMYITGEKEPYSFYRSLKKHNLRKSSKKVTCNVLLLAGEKDHYIPASHYGKLRKKLTNTHSLEGRIFTLEEGGEQHCQVGNHRLATEHIIQWLQKKQP